MSAPRTGRHDLAITLLALAALLAWEFSGADLALARLFGGAAGFPWRDAWLTRSLGHDGGRMASAFVLLVGMLDVWWRPGGGPGRGERLRWTGVVFASLLLVPALKRLSDTSCPWDLAEFGGLAAYVPHWRLGLSDGGPGHCFPSGHAVAAFAFFGMYFLWRGHRPRLARAWLLGTLAGGLLFGGVQMARGAHFASHTMWTAWLCWALAVAASRWPRRVSRPAAAASPAADPAAAPRPWRA